METSSGAISLLSLRSPWNLHLLILSAVCLWRGSWEEEVGCILLKILLVLSINFNRLKEKIYPFESKCYWWSWGIN